MIESVRYAADVADVVVLQALRVECLDHHRYVLQLLVAQAGGDHDVAGIASDRSICGHWRGLIAGRSGLCQCCGRYR
jgi:hypothetical protein